ncbi:hypothetical protein [Streptomyces griseoruber]|uniref:hypothetical protein n=1 Tax=Streptomyces griseoruber TaxID=1943 RepID=UPI0012FEB487|nr:hypothetical protein [Streptomyces griseoruber]
MTSGDRQRRDGSSKRVRLTSGDHGGPKDKKAKGRRKTIAPGGKGTRAAGLREVERFRESIRAAEQRRAARQAAPVAVPRADAERTAVQEGPVKGDSALEVYLAACLRAAEDQEWGLLKESARQLAVAAGRLEAEARSGRGARRGDTSK